MSTVLPTGTLPERPDAVNVRVYLRQSKEQDVQRESIPTQRAECERLAHSVGVTRGQWARRIEYIDIDRSGDDATREELSRLLREAQRDDLVFAWKQDRVGRDMIDSAAAIRELVKYRGCSLYTVETGNVRVTLDSAEQTALVMFRGMVAQGELERIRSRTRDGLRQRARDGYATGTVPFGYRIVLVDPTVIDRKKSKKKIEVDETLAPVVRRIFGMYLDGRGYSSIAKILNREGAPSPRGRGWSPATVWVMLREPRYSGEWTHGERRRTARVGGKVIFEWVPDDQVIRVQRPELAIISREDWLRVQDQIEVRKRDMSAQRVASSWSVVHPLSGVLKCGECGAPMRVKKCHGRRPDWNKRYYVCTGRLRRGRCTNSTHLPADDTERKLVEYIRETVLPKIADTVRDAIRGEVQLAVETANARASQVEALREDIESLRRERLRLMKLGAATDDPVPEIVEALNENQTRAKGLQEALSVATRPPIDQSLAERLEASAVAQVDHLRELLDEGHAREALTVLFPNNLRFKCGDGLWVIEAAASVPTVRHPDARSRNGREGASGALTPRSSRRR